MKKFIITPILALLVTAGTALMAQDYPDEYLGLPGDNLNLYAVMNLFQESPTLEDFEKSLNDANSRINNLDLNGDNLVDYITVSDYIDGNVHTIVLRTALTRFENQDLAVFTVQKFRDGTVQIQLVGDEALYGRNYIVEPVYDNNYAGTYNPGYTGNSRVRVNITLVSDWPIVRYIYYPGYSPWHSSWYWGYYPVYWNPWRPYYWHYYYGFHYNHYRDYYRFYRRWNHIRCDRYHDFYYGRIRSHSPMVSRRIREGVYRSTYSRPELRREGEAQYSRVYAERNQARSVSNSVNSQTRRSASQSTSPQRPAQTVENRSTSGNTTVRRSSTQSSAPAAQNRSTSGNTTVRRSAPQGSAPSVQNRTTSRATTAQRPVTNQRSMPSVVQNRSVSRPEAVQRPATSQRSAPAVQNRSVSRPEAVQRPATSQRSSAPAVQNRSVSRPESVQRPSASQRSAPATSGRSYSAPQSSPRRESAAPSRPSAPTARASSAPARSSAPAARSSSAPARSSAPAPAARSSSSSGRSSSSRESGSSQSSRRN